MKNKKKKRNKIKVLLNLTLYYSIILLNSIYLNNIYFIAHLIINKTFIKNILKIF